MSVLDNCVSNFLSQDVAKGREPTKQEIAINKILPKRFWSKIKTSNIHSYNGTPCLEWTAFIDPNGYGKFKLNGKTKRAHRLSYEESKGKIPDGLVMNHICRTRHCVNPDHLEAITQQENCQKGIAGFVGGLKQRLKTHCPHGHPYSKENTYVYPNGSRECRICKRIKSRQWEQHKKLEKVTQ